MFFFFFFNDTATTEIYTLSLHDALPISQVGTGGWTPKPWKLRPDSVTIEPATRRVAATMIGLRSEEHTSELRHGYISYAVFCLKKKKTKYEKAPHRSKRSSTTITTAASK